MPREIILTIPDPPPPPAGFDPTGFLVHETDRQHPFTWDGGTLADAVSVWVAQGTERCGLFALCGEFGADGYSSLASRYDPRSGRWGEWVAE